MVQKIPKHPLTAQKSSQAPDTNLNYTRYSVGREHEVSIATFAGELMDNNAEFPTEQMRRRNRTSPMPQDTKEIIQIKNIDHEQVDEKQQAALRAKFKENLAKSERRVQEAINNV